MKILETEFTTGAKNLPELQWHFKQLNREGKFAIYERFRLRGSEVWAYHFEVIVIGSHNGFYLNEQTFIQPAESYPSANSWGVHGWTHKNKEDAEKRFETLTKTNTETNNMEINQEVTTNRRGPKPKPFTFPNGEFTVKEAAQANSVSIPFVHNRLTAAGDGVELVRKEQHGRGRATNVYQLKAQNKPAAQSPIEVDEPEEEEPETQEVEEVEPVLEEF